MNHSKDTYDLFQVDLSRPTKSLYGRLEISRLIHQNWVSARSSNQPSLLAFTRGKGFTDSSQSSVSAGLVAFYTSAFSG